MKYLKINEGKGYYQIEHDHWIELDKISKEDIFKLLENIIQFEFDMDEFNADLLQNKAHEIIYKHLFRKFNELKQNKTRFKDESERLYKDAIIKYSVKDEGE